jgi:RNA polymerase sigma-70 factor, ECF subfamily
MKSREMKQQLIQLGNGAHALATQMLGNADDATDAVHDAYVKVMNKPGAYKADSGALAPWFLRIVRNHCIDILRRKRPSVAEVESLHDNGPGPDGVLEIDQRDSGLRKALQSLSSDQRQIIILRDYMDMSYTEISSVLEIAKGTVMSRLHRARMALKEELSRHDH